MLTRNHKSLTFFNYKSLRLYSTPKATQLPSALALSHFDQFYRPLFKNWSSVRLGLLCPHHYCAVMNVFSKKIDVSKTFKDMDVFNMREMYYLNLSKVIDIEEPTDNPVNPTNVVEDTEPFLNLSNSENDILNESMDDDDASQEYMPATKLKNRNFVIEDEYSDFYDVRSDFNAKLVPYGTIHFPENWNIFYCRRGKFKQFPSPETDASGLLNYYLMDGASILPVLALDIKKGEDVGDLCASPGGKSLAILFGMQFGKLVCNDVSISRLNKLKTVLNLYLPGTDEWSKKILVSNLDVSDWNFFDSFDKILLDVPCTNDRLSVTRDNNNIFQQKRFSERMLIPKLQTTMLCSALKGLKLGGSLVYSTCSLSPIQNDGVVHMALTKLSEECNFEFVVNDLEEAFKPLRNMFQFSDNCKYGQLVVPFLPLNYGPMYIAKISRNK